MFRASSEAGALPDNSPATVVTDDGVEVTHGAHRQARHRPPTGCAPGPAATRCWATRPGRRRRRPSPRAAAYPPRSWDSPGSISGKVVLQRNEKLHLGVELTIEDGAAATASTSCARTYGATRSTTSIARPWACSPSSRPRPRRLPPATGDWRLNPAPGSAPHACRAWLRAAHSRRARSGAPVPLRYVKASRWQGRP